MVKVTRASKTELLKRRQQVLRDLGCSERELAARAATRSLTQEESDAWEELLDIAFLLGDDG